MRNDLELAFRYVKSYKKRSVAIILSMLLGISLIVGVGTLSRSAQQGDLNRLKKDTGIYHASFKSIDSKDLKQIKENKDIKSIGLNQYYESTDLDEKLPINFVYADENYLNSDSKLIKGRMPKGNNEIVVESWILNSMGLEPNVGQEINFKIYGKEKSETFKVVGILSDRYEAKKTGMCEMFLKFDTSKVKEFTANVEFKEGSEINKNINSIANKIKIDKKNNLGKNTMLISSVEKNGSIDTESKNTTIAVSLFAGLIIYSIYSTSIYQRIRDYGMLRAIGSTNFRVFELMLIELFVLAGMAIPGGILIGIGGAQVFNYFGGNIKSEFQSQESAFVIPIKIILISVLCTVCMLVVVSLITYFKIKKISPIEAIRKNLNQNKKLKVGKISRVIGQKLPAMNSISMKNIFRNKKAFILIMISMSIGGVMAIKDDYATTASRVLRNNIYKDMYQNGDFVLNYNSYTSNLNGLEDKHIQEIKSIDGIKMVKASKELDTRMTLDKKKILNMDFYKKIAKGTYTESVLKGFYVQEEETDRTLTVKQKLKGFDEDMLKSLNDYKISGNIDIDKMKNSNLAVVYIPHVIEPYKNYFDVKDHTTGKPIVDIKVGDTVKVKIPQGKFNMSEYWSGKGDYDFKEKEFKVGAVVDYSYADSQLYTEDSGVDVIVSDSYFRNITNVNTYDTVFVDMKEGANYKDINKKIGKVSGKVPGTIVRDTFKDKENDKKSEKQIALYNYGVVVIIFVISIFNIANNVSYNITSRTNEFGMLRAIGTTKENIRNMIMNEGLIYGITSSIISVIGGFIYQTFIYETYGYKEFGADFTINYKLYLLIIIANISVGVLATYFPSKKVEESNIVESINIVE